MPKKLNSAWLLILFFSFIPLIMAQKVETQESGNAIVYLNEGLESYQQGKYREAIESFKKAIRLYGGFNMAVRNPGWREAIIKRGISESMLGDHDNAMLTFSGIIMNLEGDEAKRIIQLDTESAQAYYDLGTAYYVSHGVPGLRDFSMEAAIESFNRAISLKPDYAEAYEYLGYSYDAQHKYDLAIDAYRQVIRLKPERAESYNGLGLAYRALNRYAEAIEAFNKSISLKPDFVAPHQNLGRMYFEIGDHVSAIEQYKILKRLSPASAAEFRAYLKQ